MWYLILFVVIIIFLIYHKIEKYHRYWAERKVLCSKPTPFAGHIAKILLGKQSFFDFIFEAYNEFPGKRYNGLYIFHNPILIVKDLDLVKQICIRDFDYFSDHHPVGDEKLDRFLYRSLHNRTGEEWRAVRNTVSPAFTSRKIREMFLFMCENANNFTNYLLNKREETVETEFRSLVAMYANDVIMSAVFGVSRNTFEDPKNEFYEMGMSVLKHFSGFKVILTQISPTLYRLFRCKIYSDKINDFFNNLVTENIQQREKYKIIRPDMIHFLMEAQKDRLKNETVAMKVDTGFATAQESQFEGTSTYKKTNLTHDDLVGDALLFFLAGFETVSTVITLTAYELALNPDIQQRLQSEIFKTLEECNGNITYEELSSMKYLDQVISEILRKWPPGFHLQRICTKDYAIQPVTGEEPLLVKKGQEIFIPLSGIQRDPEYFPDPMKFDPDRFSDENKSNFVPGSYMPFGIGPRNCIASRFALLEVKVLIFHLLRKFDFVPIKRTETTLRMNPRAFVITPVDGIWLGLRARK